MRGDVVSNKAGREGRPKPADTFSLFTCAVPNPWSRKLYTEDAMQGQWLLEWGGVVGVAENRYKVRSVEERQEMLFVAQAHFSRTAEGLPSGSTLRPRQPISKAILPPTARF